ncbi:ATP-binding protein [Streptomyces sp. NBC_01451]|uniref:ATP-binding protein n=1 Tax=Streptomyces sp. NBC_01451 TaxID=2903872 RepID=UPI003FCE88E2
MPEQSTRRQYPTQAAAVRQVRTDVRAFLIERGISDASDSASAIELVVSELATNAVRHSESGLAFYVSFEFVGDIFHVSVRDHVDAPLGLGPQARTATTHAESGRGLFLVETVASAWGWIPEVVGKTVWAEVEVKTPTELAG